MIKQVILNLSERKMIADGNTVVVLDNDDNPVIVLLGYNDADGISETEIHDIAARKRQWIGER